MNKTNKEAVIEGIARHSLDCIEKVAAEAETARASHKRGDMRRFCGPVLLRVLHLKNSFNARSERGCRVSLAD
jgi:hypothetical protein